MGTLCAVSLCLKPCNLLSSTEQTTDKGFLGRLRTGAEHNLLHEALHYGVHVCWGQGTHKHMDQAELKIAKRHMRKIQIFTEKQNGATFKMQRIHFLSVSLANDLYPWLMNMWAISSLWDTSDSLPESTLHDNCKDGDFNPILYF